MGQPSEGEGTDMAFTLHGQDAVEEWDAGEGMATLFITWGSESQTWGGGRIQNPKYTLQAEVGTLTPR